MNLSKCPVEFSLCPPIDWLKNTKTFLKCPRCMFDAHFPSLLHKLGTHAWKLLKLISYGSEFILQKEVVYQIKSICVYFHETNYTQILKLPRYSMTSLLESSHPKVEAKDPSVAFKSVKVFKDVTR